MVIDDRAARTPVPDSRSSGSEYPKKPSNIARISSSEPMTQFASRGRRKAPVKKMRARCTMIAAANNSAAQWWTWRTKSPPRTSKLISSAVSYARDI